MTKTKNISILGCGWLGLPLAEHLVARGFHVKGSTRSPHKIDQIKQCGALPFVVDIEHYTDQLNAFLAADILIITITSKNIATFKNLVLELEKSPIKKVLFISSTSVYPFTNQDVTELTETINSPLRQIEKLFQSASSFQTTILRFGGLFDETRHPGRFIKRQSQLENPKGIVNLIHKKDCIMCIEEIIQHKAWNTIYNGVADTHPTREEFYTLQMKKLGLEAPVFTQKGPIKFKIISNQKIKDELQLTFLYGDLMAF